MSQAPSTASTISRRISAVCYHADFLRGRSRVPYEHHEEHEAHEDQKVFP